MKESRKEFILKAHKAACSDWKEKIEKEFPKLFPKVEIEEGVWHKIKSTGCKIYGDTSDGFVFITTTVKEDIKNKIKKEYSCIYKNHALGYNIKGGQILFGNSSSIDGLIQATNKEVELALIKEAKRGYENKNVECLVSGVYEIDFSKGVYKFTDNRLCLYTKNSIDGVWVFENGKWAEIINEMTRKEAEEKLNCKIVD